jgi:predicted dehydrogenase
MTLRLGIIGLGNIGLQHVEHILSGAIEGCRITALCARGLSPLAERLNVSQYSDYRELVDSQVCDALIVATPTHAHFNIGCYALERGLHVLMEKPIGLSVFEGERMLALVEPEQVFGLMLNQRVDPVFVLMKSAMDKDLLGPVQRVSWTMTNWFRPEVYFQTSDWRATWFGEGGGLLVNQCIHNLDILQWICGMPKRIQGFCGFGKYHDIEVEDEAIAVFEYGNGSVATFVGSTGESPGVNRFEIVGDRGMLSYDGKRLLHLENDPSTSQFSQTTMDMFGQPDVCTYDLSPCSSTDQHTAILQNFVNAVNLGEHLIAPAEEGLRSLAIANAILLSAWSGERLEMPIDSTRFHKALDLRRRQSRLREKVEVAVNIDMEKSYR